MRGLPCNAEAERLIDRYGKYVRSIAGKVARRCRESILTADDLESIGLVALLEAAAKYDPAKGVTLWTFAAHRVRGAMLDAIRSASWVPRTQMHAHHVAPKFLSLGARPAWANGRWDENGVHALAAAGRDYAGEGEGFAELLSGLTATQRVVIRGLYARGEPQKQIGERIGLSESRISQIHKTTLAYLRERHGVRAEVAAS